MTTNPTPPTTDTRPDVPELRRLLDAATEGPWQEIGSAWTEDGVMVAGYVVALREGGEDVDITGDGLPVADAALIAALHNAAPWLLAQAAAVARVEAELSEWEQATEPDGTISFVPVRRAAILIRAALAGPGVSE